MEAPNAPNPENPNAQGDQDQDQVPAGQVPTPMPTQPVPQPIPAQPAPAGVIPVPQIVYQNWIGKKPEFSGKPEEDAESHLLSTRDWMEAHNFPEGEKVRHFRVTLTGEARLWYESLTPIDNDWPTLQNKFRWQYSKIGNTPEQLFHAWRTFKFDEIRLGRLLCFENESGSSNAKLWRYADFRKFQKHPSIPTLLNPD